MYAVPTNHAFGVLGHRNLHAAEKWGTHLEFQYLAQSWESWPGRINVKETRAEIYVLSEALKCEPLMRQCWGGTFVWGMGLDCEGWAFLNGISVLIKRPVSLAPSAMRGHRKMPTQDSERRSSLAIISACTLTLIVPDSRTVKTKHLLLKRPSLGLKGQLNH